MGKSQLLQQYKGGDDSNDVVDRCDGYGDGSHGDLDHICDGVDRPQTLNAELNTLNSKPSTLKRVG